jgi:hypothetical protein
LANTDLWPDDIGQSDLVTPVSILREQAAALGPKTGNLVTAEVDSTSSDGQYFNYSFTLVAPALRYRYQLFTLFHTISLYPATATVRQAQFQITNEAELRKFLGSVLSSEETRKIVRALIAQSRE